MKLKTIEITVKLGDRDIADDVITWTDHITKSDIFVPPRTDDKDFIKFRCFYLVKCLLSAINEEHDRQHPPAVKTVHKRRRND